MLLGEKKRIYFYLLLITGLASVWLGDRSGVLPLRGRVDSDDIFKAPTTVPLTDLGDGELSEDSKSASSARARDQFEMDLRQLAASGGSGLPEEPAPTNIPTVQTATPAVVDTPKTERSGDPLRLDPSDGRSIFSGLEQAEGSQVTDILPGVVSRGSGGIGGAAAAPIDTPATGRGWVGGQARGYTMLYAMQIQARPVVEANVQALLGARVRQPYIGVLIDGTFGRDFGYLKEIIKRLSTDNRDLKLVLYLSNGPTMRKWNVTPIDQHIFAGISPEEFRSQIRRNMTLRAEFLAVVLQAKDLFQYNASLSPGNTNTAIVMLEDNLDVVAYKSMRDIAVEQLGSLAGFMRNPCVGCYDSISDDNTLGDPREEHTLERFQILKAGDAYSLDGVGFRYPSGEGTGVSSADLVELINEGINRKLSHFGIWRHDWQGVKDEVVNKRPEERVYVASSQDQQSFEIEMLRTGLIPEATPEAESETIAMQ
jgi:hypothetical protein